MLDFKKHVEGAVAACAINGDDSFAWARKVGKIGADMMDFASSGPGEKKRLDYKLKQALYDRISANSPLG